MTDAGDRDRLLELVRLHAVDVVAFQGLERSMRVWFDDAHARAAVAYSDTGRAWVATGGPVSTPDDRLAVAQGFARAAAAAGRRAVFFGVEDVTELGAWPRLHVGEQPSTTPADWAGATRRKRSLREQLRRARAKGVLARVTPATELAADTPLRRAVDDLVAVWVSSRRIEPMAFVVTPFAFTFPGEHRYVVAARHGVVVGFLSAVPAYAGAGWLVEHLFSARDAPNGTAESMLGALHESLVADGFPESRVSLGLAPLASGRGRPAPGWTHVARALTRPLFDFEGLARFKARLAPSEWTAVWLVVPPGRWLVVGLIDALSAFAGGSLARFALRSLFLRVRGLLWLLAVGLVPWTALLVWLDVTGRASAAGYGATALAAWIGFDVLLAAGLFRAALRPVRTEVALLAAAALADAALSTFHTAEVGLGPQVADVVLRGAAVLAPYVGATTLVWITVRLRER